jgi:folate-binding protein YgfZ
LQGLLTNDIAALIPGSGCYAAWLTAQGRMLTDLHVLESGDLILLDVPAAESVATLARLDQFLFSEDVQLASLEGQLTSVWIHGPAAATAVGRVVSGLREVGQWPIYHLEKGTFGDVPVVVVRIDQLGVPGYCSYLPPASRQAFEDALTAAGVVRADPAAIEAARVEAGYPLFGIDMTHETIPLEAGIEDRAISLTKGCYVGQEVIIRVLHRGHGRVAKRLVALRPEEPVSAGARILFDERDIGVVTSAAVSPSEGPVALGYVHRDFVESSTRVTVRVGERAVHAIVAERTVQ